MIDWLTLRAAVDAPIRAGAICSFTADGEVEWHCPKRLSLEGSHSSTVTVRRFPYDNTLEISGNPAKFFQGHNLFGSDDLPGVSSALIRATAARLGYELGAAESAAIDAGQVTLTRVDTTESWEFGSLPRALNVVRCLSHQSHFAHRGRGSMTREGTVYWNQRSRRLSGKAYAKGHEIRAHRLPADLAYRAELEQLAAGLVRFEFTLRSMWLKRRQLEVVQNWTTLGVTPQSIHSELMADLSVTATEISGEELESLPNRLRPVYELWKAGRDVRRMYSRPTFYRYRKQLLEHGIDIAVSQAGPGESNVVPLRVTLVGRPLEVPTWARGTSLNFEPDRIAA